MHWRERVKHRRSRTKGLQFERDVSKLLRHIFPNVCRHFEFRFSEAHGIDLDNTGRYKIQCKKYAGYVPVNTINEIKCEPMLGDVPVLITAGTDLPAMAVLPLLDLLDLIEAKEKTK